MFRKKRKDAGGCGRPDDLERVSRCWASLAEHHADRPNWLNSPTIVRRVNRRIGGDENRSWFDWFQSRYLPEARWGGRGLSLGCNHGLFERQILKRGICSAMDGYDVSRKSIEIARAAAAAEGLDLHYEVADVNTLALPPGRYDLVVAAAAVHHFERLEHVFAGVHEALTPAGFFVFNEYVGPARFQWTDAQLRAINRLRAALPPELRRLPDGSLAPPVARADLEALVREDPSESVRSDEIVPLARAHFDVVEQRDFGGTILHMFFHEILANFDDARPDHVALIEMVCAAEEVLIEEGILPSDFAVLVCRRKDAAP